MNNISIFQPGGESPTWQTIRSIKLPHSLVMLGKATGSASFLMELQLFLRDKERRVLKELRGLWAAKVGDFLDKVRKPVIVAISIPAVVD